MTNENRKIALELNIPVYESDRNCPHGHGNLRYAKSGVCVTCSKLSAKRSKSGDRTKNYARRKKFEMRVTVPPGMNVTNEDAVAFLRGCGFKVLGVFR